MLKALEKALARVDGDAIDRDDRVPPRVVAELKRLGAFRMVVPREHGGLGASRRDFHRAVALIAGRSAGLSMWVTTHALVCDLIARAGTPEQRARLLPRLAAGELGAFAMTEEGAGTDPSLLAARARPARGGYRLSGRKIWVTNGPVARWVAVIARAPGGLSAFVADARSPGFRVERRCRFLGLRGMENGVLRLDGAFVPEGLRLGAEGDGLRLALGAMSVGRLSVTARALGIARECLRVSRDWARSRRAHGAPLSRNASVAERLSRLESLAAGLASASDLAADWAAEARRDLRFDSARAKLFSASAAWEAADIALQLRGGRGYETADSQRARGEAPEPVERFLRDARGLRVIEGTDDVLRAVLARGILVAQGRGDRDIPARAYAQADQAAREFAEERMRR